MKKTVKLILVGLIGIGVVLGSLGLVYARSGNSTSAISLPKLANTMWSRFKPGVNLRIDEQAMLNDVATYLGVPVDTLKTDLKSGQTLAQIAVTQNKTEEELINFIVTERTDELKTALNDGKITQEQHDNMIENLEARVKEMVERTSTGKPDFANGMGKGFGRGFNFCPDLQNP